MKENLPVSLQKLIHKVEETFAEDPAMVELFINCFSNTLDTCLLYTSPSPRDCS